MTLRRIVNLLVFITLPLAGLVTYLSFELSREIAEVDKAQQKRFESYMLAEELLRSSDELTRFARTYVATGDERYKRHFQHVLDIRNGVIAMPDDYGGVYWDLVLAGKLSEPESVYQKDSLGSLDERLLQVGITLEEFSLLKDAQHRSDELVRMEDKAMNELMLKDNRSEAIALLHSNEYHLAKASIMQPIGQFLVLLDNRTNKELEILYQKSHRTLFLLIASSTLTLALFLFLGWILRFKLAVRVNNLVSVVELMSDGNLKLRSEDKGSDELGILSNAINDMAGRLDQAIQEAQVRTNEAQEQANELDIQRAHSEKLLNNILPVLIADRLKKGESNIAETFPEVSVLFADIVGFTELSMEISPRQLVNLLNDVFGRFDELTMEHQLEKIKTIGDCYMVVGGVPHPSSTHCQQIANFALDALNALESYNLRTGRKLKMRVGIHTGTVVAGIVGKQKYSYDLWGDVVNTASRMENASLPGKIHVTEAVRIRLSDDFNFESRGPIELKGKGILETFFLTGKKHTS
jgi:adenylate cyclase